MSVFTWLVSGLHGWRLTGATAHVTLHVRLACLQFWPVTEIMSGSRGHRGCCITLILSHRLRADSFIFSFHSHNFSLLWLVVVFLFFYSFHFSYFLLFLSVSLFDCHLLQREPTLRKSASVFHMHPLLIIVCHGARFPAFENNPSSCIINLDRACQSTWRWATPHPLLPPPRAFWFYYPNIPTLQQVIVVIVGEFQCMHWWTVIFSCCFWLSLWIISET